MYILRTNTPPEKPRIKHLTPESHSSVNQGQFLNNFRENPQKQANSPNRKTPQYSGACYWWNQLSLSDRAIIPDNFTVFYVFLNSVFNYCGFSFKSGTIKPAPSSRVFFTINEYFISNSRGYNKPAKIKLIQQRYSSNSQIFIHRQTKNYFLELSKRIKKPPRVLFVGGYLVEEKYLSYNFIILYLPCKN